MNHKVYREFITKVLIQILECFYMIYLYQCLRFIQILSFKEKLQKRLTICGSTTYVTMTLDGFLRG